MIAPDANLLIYAYAPSDPFHKTSRNWLESILSELEPVGFPIHSIYAFCRVLTHSRSTRTPITFPQAAAIVNSWLALPHVSILYPADRHWSILEQLSKDARLAGAQITDAAIVAIAIEYGATIHSNDRDFARFPGLRWFNPLEI